LRSFSMPAYIIAEMNITDPAGYEEYKRVAPPTIAKYGGRYIARGGETAVLEGGWTPGRLAPAREIATAVLLDRRWREALVLLVSGGIRDIHVSD